MPGTSRARLQKLAGIGVTKAKAMAEELWAAGKDATVKAVLGENRFAEITRMREQRHAQTARGGSVADLHALIASGFRAGVIAADPPWPLTHYGERARGGVWGHYETMPLDAIKALPIASLAADDCALFLWCAWPNMPMWHQVIEAWGFRFTSLAFDWIKLNPSEGLHGSNGYTTRQNPEPCLLAKRGKPLRLDESVHSVIEAPVGVHSEKPDEAYRRMQRLFGGPYLELFARRPRAGWKTWGKELPPTRESWDEMWKRPFNYSKLNADAPPDDPWPDLPDFLRRTAP
jgi:N6-adenosine-specific RNA methylase IME4